MKWWSAIVNWLSSTEGSRILGDAIIPFVAIVVAGVIAALIARSMGRRLLAAHEREASSAAVTSLITSARKATTWPSLTDDERQFSRHLADEASVRLRLLPIPGAGLAAGWAEHEIESITANSGTFTFQAEQTFADVRDRLIEWQSKPGRAKKLFRHDLERWRVEAEGAAVPAAAVGPTASAPAVASADAVAPTEAVAPAQAAASAQAVAPAQAASPAQAAVPASPSDAPAAEAPVVERSADPAGQATDLTDIERVDEREPAFSAPVSAGQVRRRTSPDNG